MKYFFLTLILILPLAINAQVDANTVPYKKSPTLPAFNILLTDSATVFNTFNIKQGKPTVLFYFSPDCDHCEEETEKMIARINELKGARIYMFSMLSLNKVRAFEKKFELKQYKNIVVGKDVDWFFSAYYGTKYVPFIVVYDSNKKLVQAFEGGIKIDKLVAAVNEGKK